MRVLICIVLGLAALSTPALAGGIGGGGAPEIDANSAVTAVGLLAGWAAVIHARWSKKNTDTNDPKEPNVSADPSGE